MNDDLVAAGKALERAGAEVGAIATNTMHKVFREVQDRIHLPLISIVDVTVEAVRNRGVGCVGLIGTRFTMTDPFFIRALERPGSGRSFRMLPTSRPS